jgi:hypothetical protein
MSLFFFNGMICDVQYLVKAWASVILDHAELQMLSALGALGICDTGA